jgi:hypothetical protein
MFESSLAAQLKRIFDYTKVTFAAPGESQEQDTLFIEIENCISRAKDGVFTARVTGNCTVFAHYERIPFGYFHKKIALADTDDTKDLFFFNVDENTKTFQSLVQRSFSFVFLFSGQYDPDNGSLTSIEFVPEGG